MVNLLRQLALRALLPALAGALLAGVLAPSAGAAYGGLGAVGSAIKPGSGGGHGEVNPSGATGHNFAVDPSTGDMYIAEEFTETEERLQKFGSKGEFLAENRIKVTSANGSRVGGIAVDSVNQRVYLLIADVRQLENEAKREQLEKKEETLFTKEEQLKKAEEKKEEAKVKELKEQIAKLEEEIAKLEEELPVFDEEATAAGELWSFSTVVKEGALEKPKALVKKETFLPYSEEQKGSLLHPTGIAVDPTTHDIVISGQEDESPSKGPGEEELRAAVERVHEAGTLGPRYVDHEDCLDQGFPSVAEPACEEKPVAEFPQSPIVTPQGKVYLELEGTSGELWEMPAATESGGAYKELASQPKRVFTMTGQQKLLRFEVGGEQELANTMAFASTGAGKGRIAVAAAVEGERGVVELEWTEQGEASTVTELGWTAGQPKTSKQTKCVVPPISALAPLVGASGEKVMLFGSKPEVKEGGITVEAAFASVFGFGPSGEACGSPKVTPPKVEFGEQKEATEVPAGQTTKLTSKVLGANAQSTKWKLKYEGGEETAESGYQFEAISLAHAFMHVGKYEIEEEVQTDNLGTPVVKEKATGPLTVTAAAPKVKIATPGGVHAGEELGLEATVTDANEATPHLKATWNFGDGTAPVEETESASPSPVTLKVKHAFNVRCPVSCIVTLSVEDEAAKGKVGKASVEVFVSESKAEEEARHKAEAEAAARKAAEEAAARKAAEEATARKAAEEAAQKAAEEAARKKREEEEKAAATHNPEAKVAGGSALAASSNGAVTVKVSCPAGETTCAGTVTLRTLTAVSAKAKRKAILTLATGSFSVAGGQTKAVKLHLSSKARKLLAHTHTVRAVATVLARDPSGASRTTKRTVVLRLGKARKH